MHWSFIWVCIAPIYSKSGCITEFVEIFCLGQIHFRVLLINVIPDNFLCLLCIILTYVNYRYHNIAMENSHFLEIIVYVYSKFLNIF